MSLLMVKLARDARRQWLQFAGVALTLALGVAVFGAAFDSYANLKDSYQHIYQQLGFADITVTGGDTTAIAATARDLDGVAAVATRSQADIPFQINSSGDTHTLVGRLVGLPADDRVNRVLVQHGTQPTGATVTGAVAERHMANHFHLGVGDTVNVFAGGRWQPLDVVGVGVSPEYLWPARSRQDLLSSQDDFGVLFVPDALVAQLAPGATSTQAVITYRTGADRARLDREIGQIAAAHDAGDVMVRADQPSNAALAQDVDGFGQLAVLFPLLFLVAGALAAYVLLGRLVRTQRAQIGMLTANGYPTRRLLGHYLAYGAVAGVAGSLVGAAAGVGLAVWLTSTYTSSLDIPLAVARFHPVTPVAGFTAGTIAGMLAAAAPARAAVRVPPAEAMRGVAPTGVAHRNILERIPGLRGLPIRVILAVRNLGRSPRRALSTGAGVALAAVLVLSSLGMLDTVSLVLDDQFHGVQRQDAQLYLAGPLDAARQGAVAATPGVAAAEPAIEAPVVLAAGSHRYQTVLAGFEPDTTMHRFAHGLPADGVLLGASLRAQLGVDAGSTVNVGVAGAAPVAVTVAGFVDEPLGSLAYAALPEADRLAGAAGEHSLLVRYQPGADTASLRRQLEHQPGVVAFRDARGSAAAVRQLLELFYAIVGVMLLFGSTLAFVVLFNTLSVNLSERTVELATLRAAGGRLATLARIVTGENLLLVAAAIPVGLIGGGITGAWFMSSFNSDLYHFTLRLRPTTPLLLAGAFVAITLATHVPARRTIGRLDIARIVRERAL